MLQRQQIVVSLVSIICWHNKLLSVFSVLFLTQQFACQHCWHNKLLLLLLLTQQIVFSIVADTTICLSVLLLSPQIVVSIVAVAINCCQYCGWHNKLLTVLLSVLLLPKQIVIVADATICMLVLLLSQQIVVSILCVY